MTGPLSLFFFQAEDGIRHRNVTGVQTCALPIFGMVSSLASHYEELLVPGARPARHLAASDHAFEVTTRLDGRRVLLVDDTFTSGAELQSAASALKLAGASIPAAVVIGRFIRPGFNEAAHSLWQRASDREFTFERCCLCDPPWPEG